MATSLTVAEATHTELQSFFHYYPDGGRYLGRLGELMKSAMISGEGRTLFPDEGPTETWKWLWAMSSIHTPPRLLRVFQGEEESAERVQLSAET
jgi:hypothetical protein